MPALIMSASAIRQSQDERHCHCTILKSVPRNTLEEHNIFLHWMDNDHMLVHSATQPATHV